MKIISNQVPDLPEIRTGFQTVTPAMAEVWLDKNTANRPVSDARVATLAAAMKRGEWRLTHQGIAFGADGSLYDGQHRLWAIITSGLDVTLMVTTGLEEGARADIDGQRPRSVADNFTILSGMANAKKLVECANVIQMLVTGDHGFRGSYDQSRDIIERHRPGLEWAVALPAGKAGVGAAPIRGALAFAHRTDPAEVAAFADQVIRGVDLGEKDPAYVLRNMLLSRNSRRGTTTNRRDVAVKVLRAIYACLHHEQLGLLYATEDCVAFFGRAHDLALKTSSRSGRALQDHTTTKIRAGQVRP